MSFEVLVEALVNNLWLFLGYAVLSVFLCFLSCFFCFLGSAGSISLLERTGSSYKTSSSLKIKSDVTYCISGCLVGLLSTVLFLVGIVSALCIKIFIALFFISLVLNIVFWFTA